MSLLFDEIDKLNRNMDIKQLNAICAYLHLIDSFYDQAIDEVISKHEPNQREQHEKLRNEKSAIQKYIFSQKRNSKAVTRVISGALLGDATIKTREDACQQKRNSWKSWRNTRKRQDARVRIEAKAVVQRGQK